MSTPKYATLAFDLKTTNVQKSQGEFFFLHFNYLKEFSWVWGQGGGEGGLNLRESC